MHIRPNSVTHSNERRVVEVSRDRPSDIQMYHGVTDPDADQPE